MRQGSLQDQVAICHEVWFLSVSSPWLAEIHFPISPGGFFLCNRVYVPSLPIRTTVMLNSAHLMLPWTSLKGTISKYIEVLEIGFQDKNLERGHNSDNNAPLYWSYTFITLVYILRECKNKYLNYFKIRVMNYRVTFPSYLFGKLCTN